MLLQSFLLGSDFVVFLEFNETEKALSLADNAFFCLRINSIE